MKKLVTIFAMILSGFYAKSQSSSFINIDTSCVWVHDLDYYDGFDGFPFTCNGEVTTYVEKDTFFNNKIWYKLVMYPSTDAISNFYTMNWKCYGIAKQYVRFIHEDTINKIVYSAQFGGDSLLLQYDLMLGDTVKSHPGNRIIDSITVENFNGISRTCKWSFISIIGQSKRIIDGIGPESNFPISYFGVWDRPSYYFKCFKKNGVTLYPNNPLDSCIKKPLVPVGINEWKANLFVNFSSNQLTIQHVNHKLMYFIFDLTGRKIISEEVKEQNYTKSFGHLLPSGIYILQINNGTQYLNRKIVIE